MRGWWNFSTVVCGREGPRGGRGNGEVREGVAKGRKVGRLGRLGGF